VLLSSYFTDDEVEAIVNDYRNAGLSPEEVAVMALAEKVALHAHRVTPDDIDGLRGFGLSDEEILDVVLTASSRSFFSKTLDAVGAEPDDVYHELGPRLAQALAVGRPFDANNRSD
jgi:alkylhydroperoxidase family enzyme